MNKRLSLVALAASGALFAGQALAEGQGGTTSDKVFQSAQAEEPGYADGRHQGSVSNDELENYAEIKEAIQDIETETQEAIADLEPNAEDYQDRKKLLMIERDRLVTEAIVDEGFTPDRFNEIQSRLKQDPALERRLQEVM